jgi:hypothetical protein
VKLCGVVAIVNSDSNSDTGSNKGDGIRDSASDTSGITTAAEECQVCYLLSSLSGFSVKNRLVPRHLIHSEFSN